MSIFSTLNAPMMAFSNQKSSSNGKTSQPRNSTQKTGTRLGQQERDDGRSPPVGNGNFTKEFHAQELPAKRGNIKPGILSAALRVWKFVSR